MTMTITEIMNTRQNEYRYLLLDPLKGVSSSNPLNQELLREVWGDKVLQIILRPDLAHAPEYCPRLLLLAKPGGSCDEAILRTSEQYSCGEALYEKRYVCGWINSSLAPESMADLVASLCKKLKTGMVIPFFEPLRLELLQALSPLQPLSSFIWPISQWHYLSSAGKLVTLKGKLSDRDQKGWIKWRSIQTQQQVRDIWRLLSAWGQICTSLPDDAAIQAAEAWAKSATPALHHKSDRLCLALNHLTLPVDISRHPDVQVLLQQAARDPQQHFTQLLTTLSDAVWQELSQP
ncbi:hypothetical protein [Enterobacter cancerogenus]|uniref:hypothetical protein n=1 Tax=Enterobacter cancerogenus TaxID=69218 RepID=UPI001F21630B|nr:hypothetical protein [Enterobacter cancerogenus]